MFPLFPFANGSHPGRVATAAGPSPADQAYPTKRAYRLNFLNFTHLANQAGMGMRPATDAINHADRLNFLNFTSGPASSRPRAEPRSRLNFLNFTPTVRISMRPIRAALLATALAAPAVVAAQSAPRPVAPATAPVQPIAFTQRTLANGLRVFAIRDTDTSNVSVQVWYDVGGKDDPAGRSGFAHLFEHLMFKATRNLDAEQFDKLTEAVGGNNNASTNDDYTEYHEVVPANHLQRLLFAEADRMSGLVVDQANFASERAVVEEEYRTRILAQPYGKLYGTYLPALSYQRHPYARGVIGSIENLDAATLDDVRAFHATYYRPDNAVLVVAGNFDPAQLNTWIDRYFAPIERPSAIIPRVRVDEPARTTPVSRTVYEPNTPLPAVMLSYPIPPDRSADTPALDVLSAILATGDSSRLHDSLVYRQELAQEVSAGVDSRQDAGLFQIFAIMAGGKTATQGEAALRREIARLRDQPVSAAELAVAKNQLLTAAIRGRETAEGKARTLASSVIIDGDPTTSDRQLAAIAAITPADVQHAAQRYLADRSAATIRYLPAETKPAGAVSDPITVASSVVVAPLAPPRDLVVTSPAPAGQRAALPPVAATVAPNVPKPTEMRLANGMRLVVVERHELPLVTAALVTVGGGSLDPVGKAGTAGLATDLLTKGTATRSATQIALDAETLGSSIDTAIDRDGASLSMTVKADQIAPALDIMADVARHPAFTPAEIERARAQAVDAVAASLKSPGPLARLAVRRAVFGDTNFGEALSGTPASLKAITRPDVLGNYARSWSPGRATLVMVGDVTPGAARALAARAFGDWRAAAGPTGATTASSLPTRYPVPRIVVVDLPDAGQAAVAVGRPAIPRRDPGYEAAEVANAVLGGGYSARLNEEIRIKRGLSYGAGSQLAAGRNGGAMAALVQTKNPSAPEVVGLITGEMRRIGTTPAPDPVELDARKATLIGDFGRTTETTAGIAGLLGDYVLRDVPLGELQHYAAAVQAVSAQDVVAAAKRVIDPALATILVVGDARQFAPKLRQTYPGLETIPAASLDLDKGALR
ncbi:MAG: M16 family metallopeptidase [Janthinobacterium lividum]